MAVILGGLDGIVAFSALFPGREGAVVLIVLLVLFVRVGFAVRSRVKRWSSSD